MSEKDPNPSSSKHENKKEKSKKGSNPSSSGQGNGQPSFTSNFSNLPPPRGEKKNKLLLEVIKI